MDWCGCSLKLKEMLCCEAKQEQQSEIDMDRWVGKVAVVTGASSGIGAGIAKALVEKGVLSISPGLVRTEFTEGFPQDGTKEKLDDMPDLRPDDIAEGVIYALSTGPHVNVSELTIRPVGNVF